jgi:hypothetical protein
VDDTDGGEQKYWRKTCHDATLSSINLTWIELGSKPGLSVERPSVTVPVCWLCFVLPPADLAVNTHRY